MRPRTTNAKRRAFDAYQFSFESAGALGLQTNTQGPPSHGSLYRLRLAQARHALAAYSSTSVDAQSSNCAAARPR